MQEENRNFFAHNLAFLLTRKNVSQSAFAYTIGVSQAAVSNYLNGAIPKGPRLVKISDFLGVSADDLLNRDLKAHSKEVLSRVHSIKRKRMLKALEERFDALTEAEALSVYTLIDDLLTVLETLIERRDKREK